MLSLAEYQAYANDIEILGQQTDDQIADATEDSSGQQDAIKKAKTFIPPYQQALKGIMDQALYDIAGNAGDYYAQQIGIELPDNFVRDIVRQQYYNKYYGASLTQRLVLTRLRLNRVVTQTAATGVQNLSGTFSKSFPFGAQSNVSKRLLQGTAIKVEQDVAKAIAEKANYPLVRWTLSKNHTHACHCETYAGAVDKDVKAYIRNNDIAVDPEGLFFVDDLPDPPHPNCQCEFNLVGGGEIVPSRSRRPFHRLRRLIRKLFR